CGVLLAVIGKNWLDAADESGRRRLEDPTDFVRLETASALRRDIPVVPVLVHGARMPRAEQLPEDLTELAYRNGVELSHARWDSDVQVLVKALSPYVESSQKSANRVEHPGAPQSPTPADRGSASTAPRPARKRLPTLLAASVAAVVLAAGAYVWQRNSVEYAEVLRRAAEELEAKKRTEAKAAADALEEKKRAEEERREAEKREAESRAREKALVEERDRLRQARANSLVEERERMRLAQERAAAAQRARWPSYNFPPPNGGLLVYTIMPDGNPACASYNGAGCLWGVTYDQLDFRRMKPLICGAE